MQKFSVWGLAFVLFIIGVYVLRDVLLPFVAGIAMAYFLDPLTTRLQKKLHSRIAAVCVVSVVLILLFLLCIFIIVPIVQKQLSILSTTCRFMQACCGRKSNRMRWN